MIRPSKFLPWYDKEKPSDKSHTEKQCVRARIVNAPERFKKLHKRIRRENRRRRLGFVFGRLERLENETKVESCTRRTHIRFQHLELSIYVLEWQIGNTRLNLPLSDIIQIMLPNFHFALKLERLLLLWEKILYMVLLAQIPLLLEAAENLCSTMPWTIKITLAVLWGVCWMFYPPSGLDLSDVWGTMELDGLDSSIPGNQTASNDLLNDPQCGSTDFDFISGELLKQWYDVNLILPHPEDAVAGSEVAEMCLGSAMDGDSLPATTLNASSPRPTVPADDTPTFVIGPPRANEGTSQPRAPKNSKHSRSERYLCTYTQCPRSFPGNGFCRKDHRDQHLRGVHGQDEILRIRKAPRPSSVSRNPAVSGKASPCASNASGKRRARRPTQIRGLEDVVAELEAEKRRRLDLEQENARLRQSLQRCEERMQRYEDRLDKLMGL